MRYLLILTCLDTLAMLIERGKLTRARFLEMQ